MGYVLANPNPYNNDTGDCVIRAICIAEDREWDDVFLDLTVDAFQKKLMIEDNRLWIEYLHRLGYKRVNIPDTCPDCYLIRDFARDNPKGIYIVGTGTHLVTVMDGNIYDTWNSGEKVPVYYFRKE